MYKYESSCLGRSALLITYRFPEAYDAVQKWVGSFPRFGSGLGNPSPNSKSKKGKA